MERIRKNYKIIIALALIAVLAMLPAACGSKDFPDRKPPVSDPKNPGALSSFHYSYGSFFDGEWEYKVYERGGNAYILAKGMNGVDLNAASRVEASVLDDITGILKEYKMFKWDGFNKSDYDVMDGYGFGLSAVYGEQELIASGYMKYPRGYWEAHEALAGYLGRLAEGLKKPELTDKDEITHMHVTLGKSLDIRVSIYVYGPDVSINYYHADAGESFSLDDVGQEEYDEFIDFACGLYNEYKDSTDAEGLETENSGDGVYLSITIDSKEFGTEIECGVSLGSVLSKGDSERMVEMALGLVGKPANISESEEFQLEEYKGKFRNPKVFLYDKNGLGKVMVDMPGQTATVNGKSRETGQQAMLELHTELFDKKALDSFKYDVNEIQWQHGYLEEGETAEGIFDSFIADGCSWVFGYTNKGKFVCFYGGKGDKPDEFEALARLVGRAV